MIDAHDPLADAGPSLLDTKAVAQHLGVKPNTLAQWRIKGDGPIFVYVGRSVRYRPEDVESWIAQRRCQSTSDPRRN